MPCFERPTPHIATFCRPHARIGRLALVAAPLVLFLAGACSRPQESASPSTTNAPGPEAEPDRIRVQKASEETSADALAPQGRPPFPNMATDAWGKKVIAHRESQSQAHFEGLTGPQAIERAMAHLHSVEPGSASTAASLALQAWKQAANDGERATALSLLAAAWVLDPTLEHHKARLTDAHGLVMYAGTLRQESVLGQAARAFVAVAVGRVYEGEKLTDVLSGGVPLDGDAGLFIALSRRFQAERDDAAFRALRQVIQAKPESFRARTALAEGLLELGLPASVLEAVPAGSFGQAPYLGALRGRALALAGQVKPGVQRLRAAVEEVDAADRGIVLYWLGQSLAEQGRFAETDEVMQSLAGRPGYANEQAMLEGLVAHMRGDFAIARKRAETVCSTRGISFGLALTCHWAVVDACAGLGDARCVELWGKRAVGTDGDITRLQQAKVALSLVGNAPNGDLEETLRKAHRLSPFDAELAKRVGDKTVPGGEVLSGLLRGVRHALFFGAKEEAERALQPIVTANPACRVCRGLYARAADDIDEAARRALQVFKGQGPELDEDDLIPLLDALGGSPIREGKAILERFAKDPRPRVQTAAMQAIFELANPQARQERKKEQGPGRQGSAAGPAHDHAHHEAPGTVPVPQLPFPGTVPGAQP